MKRETERIHRVLRDMLDFARPSSRAPGASSEPEPAGAVSDAVSDVLALLAPQKSFRGVDLRADVAADLPRVALSRPRLVQVLLNLLLNAASAVPPQGGRVELRAQRRGDDRVRVEVEDNGPGIAPEIQGRLFEPFATTKDVGEGTGLGLAVCRGLVEAAGGTLLAEGGSGGGAKFVMELPVEVER
jgi:two-component system, NtrC family, sensor kinase